MRYLGSQPKQNPLRTAAIADSIVPTESARWAGSRGWCFKLPEAVLSMVTIVCCMRSEREGRRRMERSG